VSHSLLLLLAPCVGGCRWRVTKGGAGPEGDKAVQTTGLRVIVALTDSRSNHPDAGAERARDSVGNACLYEGSHHTLREALNPATASGGIRFPKDNAVFVHEAAAANKPTLRNIKQVCTTYVLSLAVLTGVTGSRLMLS
jgi:hypothetical protein